MKKIFTLIAFTAWSAMIMATDYTDRLSVTVNGVTSTQNATISVEKESDSYTLSLKNFKLVTSGTTMYVGNIVLDSIKAMNSGETTVLATSQDIAITAGSDPTDAVWIGPMLGNVPVNLTARIDGDKLYTVIDINMATMGQTINVVFGKGYQIQNGGFEEFTTVVNSSVEPRGWHSFKSATGGLAALAGDPVSMSTEIREGALGSSCALIKSSSVMGIIANGTMTTGRLNAGAFSATDTKNHSSADISSTDTDVNGDPFYTEMTGQPDSLTVWVKFIQGTPNAQYPYASVSAAITDGTYYQDPEDKTYNNVMARAKDNTIKTMSGKWQRISIPFTYNSDVTEGKALLVTITTNATPGKGSATDELYVDDIRMIYNADLTQLTVNGKELGFETGKTVYETQSDNAVTADDIQATGTRNTLITKNVEKVDGGYDATVTVYAADLSKSKTYTIHVLTPTGISNINTGSTTDAIYNISGMRVNSMDKSGVYIIKSSDGKTRKVLRK